jgi:AraC-like DNA-binding protein
MKFLNVPEKGDPSNLPQIFSGLNINLLCCRYWWLKNWESRDMSFPYWRIYWNKNRGSTIKFEEKITELNPDRIVLIPPYTAFSSQFKNNTIPPSGYCLEGGRVDHNNPASNFLTEDFVLHLFIHFNLGMPYDFISPQIFSFEVSNDLKNDLERLTSDLQENHEQISVQSSLIIYKIIILTVSQIPKEYWNLTTSDQRILNVLRVIEEKLSEELTNQQLAQKANMAINSFTRFFREEIGVPPQQFIRQRRVQKASILLHHTAEAMEEIARRSGFCDRFHLARVFKETTGYSPAQYRKQFYPKS